MTGRDTVDDFVDYFNILDPGTFLATKFSGSLGSPTSYSMNFAIPYNAGNYIMRAYSGGFGDWNEVGNVWSNQYDGNSRGLWLHALRNNLGHVFLDDLAAAIEVLSLVPVDDKDATQMFSCLVEADSAWVDIEKGIDNVDTSSRSSFQAGITLIVDTAVHEALSNAKSCGADVAKSALASGWSEVYDIASTKVKGIVDAGTGAYKTGMNLGQLMVATPVETAVISVQSNAATSITVSPTSLTFSTPVTVGNQTSLSLTVTQVSAGTFFDSVSGTNAGDFTPSGCTMSLTAGATCTVSVAFKPTASGTRTASLNFTNANGGALLSVPLTGTGSGSDPRPTVTGANVPSISSGQWITIYGTGFTNNSWHRFSYDIGGPIYWTEAQTGPKDFTPTSMSIYMNDVTKQPVFIDVCTAKGSSTCSLQYATVVQK
jgi:hypothetical protein